MFIREQIVEIVNDWTDLINLFTSEHVHCLKCFAFILYISKVGGIFVCQHVFQNEYSHNSVKVLNGRCVQILSIISGCVPLRWEWSCNKVNDGNIFK